MPIYEYRCQECQEVSAFLVRSGGAAAFMPACRACGSSAVARRMSTFALGKTTAGVHEAHPAGSPNRDYYRDPPQHRTPRRGILRQTRRGDARLRPPVHRRRPQRRSAPGNRPVG